MSKITIDKKFGKIFTRSAELTVGELYKFDYDSGTPAVIGVAVRNAMEETTFMPLNTVTGAKEFHVWTYHNTKLAGVFTPFNGSVTIKSTD